MASAAWLAAGPAVVFAGHPSAAAGSAVVLDLTATAPAADAPECHRGRIRVAAFRRRCTAFAAGRCAVGRDG
jgi:hypothetical protein